MARHSVRTREYSPGTPAPAGGVYESCNVFGSAAGGRVTLARGETLPAAPRGFTWRVVRPLPGQDAGPGGTVRPSASASRPSAKVG